MRSQGDCGNDLAKQNLTPWQQSLRPSAQLLRPTTQRLRPVSYGYAERPNDCAQSLKGFARVHKDCGWWRTVCAPLTEHGKLILNLANLRIQTRISISIALFADP